jgi:hypothetical protein
MPNGFTPTGEKFTEDELKFGYWFVSNKVLLRKIGLFTLMVIDAILVLAVLYGLVNFYIISRPEVQAMNQSVTSPALDYQYLFEQSQPLPLEITFSESLRNSSDSYDFVSEITNNNTTWYAQNVTYHFESGSFVSKTKSTTIMPGQTKYIMALGQTGDFPLNTASLVVDKVTWKKQANFDALYDKMYLFEVENPVFESSQQSGLSGEVPVSRVSFAVRNASAYNYGDMTVSVLLYRASSLVGVNEISVARFDSGETKDLSYAIYGSTPGASRVEVIPDVDILNPASFKSFDGEGEFK